MPSLTRRLARNVSIVIVVALIILAAGALTWKARTGSSQEQPQLVNLDPPKVAPDPAAIVNGTPVRGYFVDLKVANGASLATAIQDVIDIELEEQASKRLGLRVTKAEAVEWLKAIEDNWKTLPPKLRKENEASLIAQGLPTKDLYKDPVIVEQMGVPGITGVRLRQFLAEQAGVAMNDLNGRQKAYDDFIAEERAKATIIDCRTEDCSAAGANSD
ncbi:MAG: hypothetical protein WBD55_06515 [Dehalococcoidia bacterium]